MRGKRTFEITRCRVQRSGREEKEAAFNGEKKGKSRWWWVEVCSRVEAKLEDIARKNDHDKKGETGAGKRKLSHHYMRAASVYNM